MRLSMNEKDQICLLKLRGFSGPRIAEELGRSRQTIYGYLNTLPPQGKISSLQTAISCDVDEETACQMFHLYNQGKTVVEICEELSCTEDEIINVFTFIKAQHRNGISGSKYKCWHPTVRDWIEQTGTTYKDFSDKLGIYSETLWSMLYGKRYLTLDIAKKIKRITGLTIKEIYSEFYEDWKEKYEAMNSEQKNEEKIPR